MRHDSFEKYVSGINPRKGNYIKIIINRKLYDTDTATLLGEYDNELDDLSYIQEKLYQKKNGEYFLLGEGGPRTEYCSMDGSSRGWGYEIIPFSKKEAMDWSEEKSIKTDKVYNSFITQQQSTDGLFKDIDGRIFKTDLLCHVRPHATKGAYKLNDGYIRNAQYLTSCANELPNGEWMTNQCFWFNKSYIKRILD